VPSKRPSEIFNMFFINRIVNEQDQIMVSIIADNSTHNNWIPQGKAFFHHGESDPIVPYFNSEDAYNGLSNLGGDVTLYSYPNGDHFSEVGNFMSRTFNDFNELK
jgi:acetyl esterase/lipase